MECNLCFIRWREIDYEEHLQFQLDRSVCAVIANMCKLISLSRLGLIYNSKKRSLRGGIASRATGFYGMFLMSLKNIMKVFSLHSVSHGEVYGEHWTFDTLRRYWQRSRSKFRISCQKKLLIAPLMSRVLHGSLSSGFSRLQYIWRNVKGAYPIFHKQFGM